MPGIRSGELRVNVGADLVAFAADRRARVEEAQTPETRVLERRDAALDDSRRRARQPECSSAIAPDGCAMNTGTQSATVTASAVPRSTDSMTVGVTGREATVPTGLVNEHVAPCTWSAVASRGPPDEARRRSARPSTHDHRATGSSLLSPKLPTARVVVNARIPNAPAPAPPLMRQ